MVEYERRFLLKNMPKGITAFDYDIIEQWYSPKTSARYRTTTTKAKNLFTIKYEKIIKKTISPGVNSEKIIKITKK